MAKKNFKQLIKNVKAFAFDIDGVFTDGTVLVLPGDDLPRTMSVRDGFAVKHAVQSGYKMVIISGGRSEAAKIRLEKLGVHKVFIGRDDKVNALGEFMSEHKLKYENILFMGDDMPDYEVMQKAGISCCPKDACNEIKELSVYVSDKKGGEGCVRDVIEQVMKVQGCWIKK